MDKLIPPNIKLLAPLIFILVGIIATAFVIFKIGTSQISLQTQKIKEGKEEKNALTQKETILSGIKDEILQAADFAIVALPDSNTSLSAFSQLKTLVGEKALVLSNLSVGSSDESGKSLKRASMSFDVEGPAPAIIDFANSLNTTAPIMLLDNMSLTNDEGVSKATFTVGAYWATLPTSIPALTDGLSDLTEEEMTALQGFANLRAPNFSSLQAQPPVQRDDPFN